jgi:hypothetical protein
MQAPGRPPRPLRRLYLPQQGFSFMELVDYLAYFLEPLFTLFRIKSRFTIWINFPNKHIVIHTDTTHFNYDVAE